MSLFDSLTTAVSGLAAQQRAIGDISDNIANAQTVGYKGVDTSFQSLVFSNGNFQIAGGVAAQSNYTPNLAGSFVSSQEATSLAIDGAGYFVVKAPPGTSSTGTTQSFAATDFYTRRGDFTVDKNGYLVNGSGYYLEGYPVSATTGAPTGAAAAPIQIPQSQSAPTATSLMALVANLPGNYALSSDAGYVQPSPVTTQIYDSQGNAHGVSIQFDHTAANTWTATITGSGSQSPQANPVTLQLTFGDGSTTAADGSTPAPGTLLGITDISSPANGTAPVISTDSASGSAATVGLAFNFGGANQTVTLNLGAYGQATGLSQYGGTSVDVTSETQNGSAAGALSGLAIDQNGYVNLTYTNGQTVKGFQLALAQFNAPSQLQNIDGTVFAQSNASGAPTVTVPGGDGTGAISPSTLEQSNVDISTELTKLISAQQVYTSNARVITTAQQMLLTLNQLIQG